MKEAMDPLIAKKRAEEKTRKERERLEMEQRKRGGGEGAKGVEKKHKIYVNFS